MVRRVSRAQERTPDAPAGAQAAAFTVTGVKGVHLVHREEDLPEALAEAAEALHDAPGQATVLVGALPADEELDAFARALAPLVGGLRARGVRLVRLVMSQGALDRRAAPSPARRLCEDWGLEVIAPSGPALIVPGGSLFSPDGSTSLGGWWLFVPGAVPRRIGARLPRPAWESHLARVPAVVAEDYVVQQMPAGLLVRPVSAPSGGPESLGFAVPVDPGRPLLLVGAPDAPDAPEVSADAVADVLAALPSRVRASVRLVPANGRDLLALGQETADTLGLDVDVTSGLPVLLAADPLDGTARTVIVGPDGSPAWEPYVESVTCSPAGADRTPEPRMGNLRSPAAWLKEGSEPGVFLLDDRWQTTLTWSGLWVGRHGDRPPLTAARPADGDVVAIDLGGPGRAIDDSLWPSLDRLFASLEDEVRERAMIQVHGNTGATGQRTLRRLAIRHGMVLAPKGWSSARADTAQVLRVPLADHPGQPAAPTPGPHAGPPLPEAPPIAPPVQYVTTTGGTGPAEYSLSPDPRAGAPEPDSPHLPEARHATTAATPASTPQAQASSPLLDPHTSGTARPGTGDAVPTRATAGDAAPVPAGPSAPHPSGGDPHSADGPAREEHPSLQAPIPAEPYAARATDGDMSDRWAGPKSASPSVPTTSTTQTARATDADADDVRVSPAPQTPGPNPADPQEGAIRSAEPVAAWPPPDPLFPPSAPQPTGPLPEPEPFTPLFTSSTGFEPGDNSWSPDGTAPQTAAADPEEAPSASPESPSEAPGQAVLREVTYVPVLPNHRSSAAERQGLRSHVGADWERHTSAAQRTLTTLPGLRPTGGEDGDPIADLAALYAYLGAGEGRLGERELAAALDRRDPDAVAYLACLASGLRRLPSYRGATVLTAGVFDDGTAMLLPGEEVGATVPVISRAVGEPWYPTLADDHYLIWSSTGRRVGSLREAGPAASTDVVFGPGSRFRVLEVRDRGEVSVVVLREVPPGTPPTAPGMLNTADVPVLERLRALADEPAGRDGDPVWAAGRRGVLGIMPDASPAAPGR
ncbi:hypothetical protein [Streptomyces sp. NBC_01176]|uniref:hypothetical protein n=1 Tax=Streptomyces sp. NBC_01176 TaxID=2903760 RepID=UPI002F91952D|nr:hypothetical protein OG199_44630 [Streptomyces sp. NBC_01176]